MVAVADNSSNRFAPRDWRDAGNASPSATAPGGPSAACGSPTPPLSGMHLLSSSSLLESRSARVALARERYFEEGQSPAGVVSELVFESWARCLRVLGSPARPVEFQPVTASRTHLALQRNRHLLGA